jgi:hypothetical protein
MKTVDQTVQRVLKEHALRHQQQLSRWHHHLLSVPTTAKQRADLQCDDSSTKFQLAGHRRQGVYQQLLILIHLFIKSSTL